MNIYKQYFEDYKLALKEGKPLPPFPRGPAVRLEQSETGKIFMVIYVLNVFAWQENGKGELYQEDISHVRVFLNEQDALDEYSRLQLQLELQLEIDQIRYYFRDWDEDILVSVTALINETFEDISLDEEYNEVYDTLVTHLIPKLKEDIANNNFELYHKTLAALQIEFSRIDTHKIELN